MDLVRLVWLDGRADLVPSLTRCAQPSAFSIVSFMTYARGPYRR